ncbi:probable LRR receptor-like serine/threonine-protein kinase RFK1 isoform X1 [Cornus florida]|uniref:probable LRR receptor-like serine/threonine-protein kinase RFK1 isoform X1 n=2 Tax=Cornus florida TaxID=4283 RepID=UPI0028A0614B|nr:probable LRR receptor-like serine/threonine-protein kinase RFK1 isoform X1 [Cornus florida]XP_059664607.1 probable LRR receptor-like serine/threonine-protein kinase RFK1 isoform X1 [Cornus florida]
MPSGNAVVFCVLALSCFASLISAQPKLPQDEVYALQQILTTMGATYLKFNADSCQLEMVAGRQAPSGSECNVECDCQFENNTVCHVVSIVLKKYSLPGVLPPELVNLPYLQTIDFAYNYLNGTIPREWASLHLNTISVLANRLSGEIPKELGTFSNLTYLSLEANQFSGTVPPELGKLINLDTLMLSSNHLTGKLPMEFSGLRNLTDFRINDNNFNGTIPDFIQNWKKLQRLEMHASGLEGPIPSSISLLDKLTELRISDINGMNQGFPNLSNAEGLVRLVLRNCNISGEVPPYIWIMKNLQMLDVSFNRLTGEIPNDINTRTLKFVFLSGNMLSGDIPASILKEGSNIDLSYNNFTWQGPEQPSCQENMNLYINLFKSSSAEHPLKSILPCTKDFNCPRYGCSLHVNCGGNDLRNRTVLYEGDAHVEGGTAKYFRNSNSYWGFSSTGDFLDDDNYQNARYTEVVASTNISEFYRTARLSPLSLTYFRYCLENGDYTVSLHFAEIQFIDNNTFSSLGRRIFDIYIQEKLVWKDFNIKDEGHGAQRPVVKQSNASVTNNMLEIRFYWTGKGTTRIPDRGVYGPLVSAISVHPNFKTCSAGGGKKNVAIYATVGVVAFCIIFVIFIILWWKGCFKGGKGRGKDFEGLELQTVSFTLKQIKTATNNFDSANKIGEGGFGPVYKGLLPDGTIIAVKQLSSKSRQGNREFLNEIGMISCLQHPNLVKLHGCCIEKDQLLLVYEYMENNNLARALFASENSQLILDWPTRLKICIGIARGLAFLHEESRFKIVHRDIKATNVLLDRDLNPKISDFGLAKLYEDEEKTHISTRIAGTIGYMAPEYALWGYLSYKADVYSFGIVVLEIVSGKNNNNYMPSNNCICLFDWACSLQQNGNLLELVNQKLGSQVNKEEAETMVKVGLLCTNASPSLRPTMTEVVNMLEGQTSIPEVIPDANTYTDDFRFKAMRDFHREKQRQIFSGSQTQNSTLFERR